MDITLEKNKQVRISGDNESVGVLTGESRSSSGGRILFQVNIIGSGLRYIPKEHLEEITSSLTPSQEIKNGKFVSSEKLRLILVHNRLSGRLADMIYSMEATNTEFFAYQFKPVLKLTSSPSNSVLIADEVGLGKTIEAGLIWTELRARFDAKRLIVLCPYSLRHKWQDELISKFGVDAKIVNAEELYFELNSSIKLNRAAAYICAMQSMRPNKGWQEEDYNGTRHYQREIALQLEELKNDDPVFDLLIVDEAHHLRNEETQIHKLGKILRNVSDFAAFLSATPIHLKNKDLFSLLKILDEGSFEDIQYFQKLIQINIPLIEARDNILTPSVKLIDVINSINNALTDTMLSESRSLKSIVNFLKNKDELSNEERANIAARLENANLLTNIITRMRRRDVQELRVIRRVDEKVVDMNENEREFYENISKIVNDYADTKNINRNFLLASPQRMLSSSMAAAHEYWSAAYKDFELDENIDNADPEDIEKNFRPLKSILSKFSKSWKESLSKSDSKFNSLYELVINHFKNEKVIIFSSFKPTLKYLERKLEEQEISSITISGNINGQQREQNIKTFRDTDIKILLASEVGSEGLDLQFCKNLINYDLPWNPMRVEQRIGRVDRFGQKSDYVTIINILYQDTIDQRIYDRLYKRLKLCEEALGSFENILGDELRKLEKDLFLKNLTPQEEILRIEQTAQALENKKQVQENLENEAASLIAHGDYILNKINAAKEFNRWVNNSDLANYIISFFAEYYPASQLIIDDSNQDYALIKMDNDCLSSFRAFLENKLSGNNSKFLKTSELKIKFGKLSENSSLGGYELITQQHPLIRFITQVITEREISLSPAVYSKIDRNNLNMEFKKSDYLICISKWSIVSNVSNDKIVYSGLNIKNNEIIKDEEAEYLISEVIKSRENFHVQNEGLELIKISKLSETLYEKLQDKFLRYEEDFVMALEDKVKFQQKTMKFQIEKQIESYQSTLKEHIKFNRVGLSKATESKIFKLEERLKERFDFLERSKKYSAETSDVSAVIVNVF